MLNDILYAVRSLKKHPGFTTVAVFTLALGIGANTAIFSVVNAVLFRPIPAPSLDQLVVIREDLPGLNLLNAQLAPAEVVDLANRTDVFPAVTGFLTSDRTLSGYGEPARLETAATVGDFRGVFGVERHLGRLYDASHSIEGPFDVAVVSYGLWQQLGGGDSSFVGSTIRLDDVAHVVVGVLPRGFRYPRDVQVWVPFAYTDAWKEPQRRGTLIMTTVARVGPGLSDAHVAAALDAEAARWKELYYPGAEIGKLLHATDFVAYLAGPLRTILLVLLGAVAFVLLIAAANVASLQLVRVAGRSRELAVRTAIGAGRVQIVRQLLAEALLLAAAGGAVGLWLGSLSLDLLEGWAPAQQMYLSDIPLDGTVLAFTALAALVSAVVFGVVPALRAAGVPPLDAMRESGRGESAGVKRHRLLRASVALQLGLALLLVLGSGLMVRTLAQLLGADPGFVPENVTTAQVSVAGATYDTPAKRLAFFDAVMERLRALPGVDAAALVWGLPFSGQGDSSPFDIPGRPARPGEPERHAEARMVSPGYFRAMGVPLLRGADFDGSEQPGSPFVAVIDETFAKQFFPDQDPVGREITGYFGDPATIIGVAGRVDHREVGDRPKAIAYYSYRHQPWLGWRSLVVRSELPVGAVTELMRTAVADIDPNVPVYDVQTMAGRIERSLGPRRLAMLALGAFAVLSALLASLGVYGVMRYTTSQRTHEIGIRMAVGARPRDVLGLVIRQGLAATTVGLVGGFLAALALTRLMAGMLFGVSPHDPATFVAATVLLAAIAVLATYLPARRATLVDPVEALRTE
jgi:putative ABC transport system permease protein